MSRDIWAWYNANSLLLFFFYKKKKLITTMHIYTYYLLWYWPFFFKAIQTTFRLEEITNSSSSWRMKGRGGLQLCKHWMLLNKATQSWRKNWPTRSTLGKVLTRLWRGHKVMHDTIYYLIIVIYYFWYFYVKNVILDLGDLFPCF